MPLARTNAKFPPRPSGNLPGPPLDKCVESGLGTINHSQQGDSGSNSFPLFREPAARGIHVLLSKVAGLALLCAGLLLLAETSFAQAVPFVATGSMSIARQEPDAILLNNGKVLISGGQGPTGTANPEVYDPGTGTFSSAGTMNTLRLWGTATLLNSGQVLFTGGFDNGSGSNQPVVATAELYDPVTNTFSITGSMTTPRVQHTAVLLSNGMVLITGGRTTPLGLLVKQTWRALSYMTRRRESSQPREA